MTLAGGWLARPALGDGDPASDVLATQPLFLPQDAGIAVIQQVQLEGLLSAARRSGYPLRVAIIASPADLGSITELWGQPESYARFLGQELSLLAPGPLLVVMPTGYGVYPAGGALAPERSVLKTVTAPGGKLGPSTLAAIQRLAAAAGHNLPLPEATSGSSSGSGDTLPWIVFAIGAAGILLAWTVSLRARPLGRRKQAAGSQ